MFPRLWSLLSGIYLLGQLTLPLGAHAASNDTHLVFDWDFSGAPGGILESKNRSQPSAKPIELEGDALAVKGEENDPGHSGWQFVGPVEGKNSGLAAEVGQELLSFRLSISCKIKSGRIIESPEYLVGITERLFVRFTEANRLEAAIFLPGVGWKEIGVGLTEITPWDRWMDIVFQYDGESLVLEVDNSTVGSLSAGRFNLPGGSKFVVGACPWETNSGVFTGQIRHIALAEVSD